MKIHKTILILLFFISAVCFSADFFDYLKDNNTKLYNNEKQLVTELSIRNHWYEISDIYYQLYKYRLGAETDIDDLEDRIDDVIDKLEDDDIKGLTDYETSMLITLLYGIKSYVNSTEVSIRGFGDLKKSYKLSRQFFKDNSTVDSKFCSSLISLVLAAYFENSFWIKDIMGYDGNVIQSLVYLNNISNEGDLLKTEASIFLSEFYSKILLDHRNSIIYTEKLKDSYQECKYFKFLYAKDLYHTGKIDSAYKLFREVDIKITNNYYPFEYVSLIYEIKCLYVKEKDEIAEEVLKYAKNIHEGYLTGNLNKWKYSLKRRKEIIHRFEKLNFRDIDDITKNDHDIKLTSEILFDHCYFSELTEIINVDNNDPDLLLLQFRSMMSLKKYKSAEQVLEILGTKHEDFLDDHEDIGRIKILKNILDNALSK
ncbi:MAG: hypothetical protein KAS62_04895 [Candidatus Delongbacteria bacterium]|nr:hypothetical protein [Candidatus Delongbacteria bacterium]